MLQSPMQSRWQMCSAGMAIEVSISSVGSLRVLVRSLLPAPIFDGTGGSYSKTFEVMCCSIFLAMVRLQTWGDFLQLKRLVRTTPDWRCKNSSIWPTIQRHKLFSSSWIAASAALQEIRCPEQWRLREQGYSARGSDYSNRVPPQSAFLRDRRTWRLYEPNSRNVTGWCCQCSRVYLGSISICLCRGGSRGLGSTPSLQIACRPFGAYSDGSTYSRRRATSRNTHFFPRSRQ